MENGYMYKFQKFEIHKNRKKIILQIHQSLK